MRLDFLSRIMEAPFLKSIHSTVSLGQRRRESHGRQCVFKYVWRFNGLILMVAGLLAIAVLTFSGYQIYSETTRERNTRNIVNIQEETEIQEKWQLGNISKIQGTPFVMIPLNSDQSYAQSYYSKSTSSARNYLFIDSESNVKHWLFDTNKYLIADSELLSEHEYGSKKREIKAILYKVIKEDSDNDKRLTSKDIKTIGISMPSGRKYKELIKGVDVFFGHKFRDENTLLVVYQKQGVGYSANVDLSGFALSNEEELPKVIP